MEIVDLLSYRYSNSFYCWGLVLAGQVTGLISGEMVVEVVDFDFVIEVVDFPEDFVEENNLDKIDMMDRMVDTNSIVRTFHRDFASLEPKIEIYFEVEAKVATNNSNLVEADYTFGY